MHGLTQQQVEERIKEGEVNYNETPITRTHRQIILSNTLTFFNFINVILFILVAYTGSYKNCLFIFIAIINTIIGIVQEFRAKKILDDLAILTESKVSVIRNGKAVSLPTDQLVLGDLIILKSGDQIPADAIVVDGRMEVNESLLTGESDTLLKERNAELYSGSVVTSGQAYCQVVHVGKDNYASKITSEAKEFRTHNSELRNSLNSILRVVSIIIIPMGVALFYKQYFIVGDTFKASILSMTSGVLGMIPEGLILLTSIALTFGSIRLALKKTLVQELYCIETLARVDTLCLDKTGTITEGSMRVDQVIPIEEDVNVADVMGNLMRVLEDDNATFLAMKDKFPESSTYLLHHEIPFSSDRKYSGAAFSGKGTYLVGAVQFLFPTGQYSELSQRCRIYAESGLRVLVLAHSPVENRLNEIPTDLEPCAIILITDVIRKEAPDTISYFYDQEVDLKVISGDDPATVASIARRAGMHNADAYVDAGTLETKEDIEEAVENYSVFGRVTPEQKKEMVLALKKQGHTVAMTGDGVNDVLALKEADCSVAMASGSDAAQNISNIVLLESNFSVMPDIVKEGRRVVNNIRMAASMFLVKTIFSMLLSVLTVFFGARYPFEPIQLTLISACAVSIPTFLLNQESNYEKIDKSFLRHVFMNAFPTALTVTICVFSLMLVCQNVYGDTGMLPTACVLVTGWSYMQALLRVYQPLNFYRSLVIYGMQVVFFIGVLLFQNLLELQALEFGLIVQVFVLMALSPMMIDGIRWLLERVTGMFRGRQETA